jgi:hypothetical protein
MIRTVTAPPTPDEALECAAAAFVGADGPLAEFWGRSPVIVREAGLHRWIPGAAELLRTPLLRPPYLAVLRGGKPVPPEKYCRPDRIVLFTKLEPILDVAEVDAAVEGGAAVKFNRMELWSPPIATMAAEIGRACGRRVKAWGFLSPRGEMMVPSHRDPAHVLALQLAGTKRWQLGGPCPDGAWSPLDPMAPPGEDETFTLAPGEALYLPHGYAHCAAADTELSFHVSFAIEGTTAGEVRGRAAKYLSDALDLTDATEIGPANLAAVLDGLRESLDALAERTAEHAKTAADRDPVAVLDDLYG